MHSRTRLFILTTFFSLAGFGPSPTVFAHDQIVPRSVVIDTDMGLDDVVALTLALQHPDLQLSAIVVCPGAVDGDVAADYAEAMLDRFNRSDIPLYAASAKGEARTHAQKFLAPAMAGEAPRVRQAFSPEAYRTSKNKTIVLALGPLTNIAAALKADPELAKGIQTIVIQGLPQPERNWNIQADAASFEAVKKSGVQLRFVVPGREGSKPPNWSIGQADFGPGTSLGEMYLRKVFASPETREHYLESLDQFTDELLVLYLVRPDIFGENFGHDGLFQPVSRRLLGEAFHKTLVEGRCARGRLLFVDGRLPDEAFKPLIRRKRDALIVRHGETEWFAQLLLNEVHQHIGAFSVIGVKMGIRAAELLNAPQHGMTILSHSDGQPPVSCLNDGLYIGTGSTPGRALFSLEPGERGSTEVEFRYNGRTIMLRLKPERQKVIREHIQGLLREHTLEDDAYWKGVEQLSFEIWENWSRTDIFDVNEGWTAADATVRPAKDAPARSEACEEAVHGPAPIKD